MKLKTRLLAPLFAVLMLGAATSAFADVSCAVTAPPTVPGLPVAKGIINGYWENTSDLLFTCNAVAGFTLANAPTTDTSLTIYYGGNIITNSPIIPAGHVIEVFGSTLAGVVLDTTRVDTGGTGVNNAGSLVAVLIPAQAVPVPTFSFTVRNVLLSLAGSATLNAPVIANVNVISFAGNTVLTGSPIAVIGSVVPELSSSLNPPALVANPAYPGQVVGPAQFNASGVPAQASPNCPAGPCQNNRSTFTVSVSEDHPDAWRSNTQYYLNGIGTSANGTQVVYQFANMLPGSIISNCVLTSTSGVWQLTGSGIAGTAGTTTLVAEPQPATVVNTAQIDTLTLACGTTVAAPAYLVGTSVPPATKDITVQMQPFPAGPGIVALPGIGGTPSTAGGTPRYALGTAGPVVVGPLTVISFGGSSLGQTTMIIPYALSLANYDTGIAIANTTKDTVFGTDAQGAAPDAAGTITFNFYPADATQPSFAITTSSVASGASYISTLSGLLKAGGGPATFQGYIIAVASFTHAHGSAYVYGGGAADRLTSATGVLVISNPGASGRALFNPLTNVEVTAQ